ncbi:hypothetical protein PT974_05749 [Cladobotryum mycophilum]|uniref:Uncharacterized protein n=1 Tax=Cladobotryum mycophilum TaxID=491253 RepID=A0ABR0SKR9_9HYPO
MSPQTLTDVYPFDGMCAINIDHQSQEYRVCWTGDKRKPPNLSSFPELDGATATRIPHSAAVDGLWTRSKVMSHGYDSHIRELVDCDDEFPICKVAINSRQRRLVEDEFRLLRHLSTLELSIPIAKTSIEALEDDGGIYGFRMEKLEPLD